MASLKVYVYLFLVGFLIISPCPVALAQEASEVNTTVLANTVLDLIYSDIFEAKSKHAELTGFDESAITTGENGIKVLEFVARNHKNPYAFGVTILNMSSRSPFHDKKGAFNYSFPLLKLKLSGYQSTVEPSTYNIMPSILKHGRFLWDEQQKWIPLRLSLQAARPSFKVGEEIEFMVTLSNHARHHTFVLDLSEQSLYCTIDGSPWGTPPEERKNQKDKRKILKSGESIKKQFRGKRFSDARPIDIICTYALSMDGVYPGDILTVDIVK